VIAAEETTSIGSTIGKGDPHTSGLDPWAACEQRSE
jgi:hypothetical protein